MDNLKEDRRRIKWVVIGLEFVILYVFWFVLSARFDPKNIVMGIVVAALVTFLTYEFLYNPLSIKKELSPKYVFTCAIHVIQYFPWLVLSIIKANIQVAGILIKRQMPIDPVLLQFETKLSKRISLVTLANSITITPGTITVELQNGKYVLHSLVRGCAGDLETGLLQNKVAQIFDDNLETTAPNCLCVRSLEELEQ
jgi:multicomponent Na+:H+ antiporter subunit E